MVYLPWRHGLLSLQCFVVLLEARDNAKIGLTLWAMVLGLPSQNPAIAISGVPTVVAAKGWSLPGFGTVTKLVSGCLMEDKYALDYSYCYYLLLYSLGAGW